LVTLSKTKSYSDGQNEDLVGAYMRQIGSIPRLTNEEEYYYSKAYNDARISLQAALAQMPPILLDALDEKKHIDHAGRKHGHFSLVKGSVHSIDSIKQLLADALAKVEIMLKEGYEQSIETRQLIFDTVAEQIKPFKFTCTFYSNTLDRIKELDTEEEIKSKTLLSLEDFQTSKKTSIRCLQRNGKSL